MNETQQRESFAFAARVLGALFYFAPDSEQASSLVNTFTDGSWLAQWPQADASTESLVSVFSTHGDESLPQAFQRLFVGPWTLPAPPWGSVWLDHESVLFGDSTLELRQWMRTSGITFETQQNEPEDHIGTLLMLAAWLNENGRFHACDQLLAWHLLPWSARFLSVFVQEAGHPFYRALGQLTQQTLAQWQQTLIIPVAEKKLYR